MRNELLHVKQEESLDLKHLYELNLIDRLIRSENHYSTRIKHPFLQKNRYLYHLLYSHPDKHSHLRMEE